MIARLLLVLSVVFSPLAIADDTEEQSPVILRPAAVLVSTPNWPSDVEHFRRIILTAAAGALRDNVEYGEQFRKPTNGDEPHPVDCKDATSLGFVFIAGWRPGERSTSSMKIRYDWQHDSVEGRRGKARGFLTRKDVYRAYDDEAERSRSIYIAPLKLDKKGRKTDGSWTLTVSFRGDELHREVFTLQNCET